MIDSIIERITNQHNASESKNKLVNSFTNIKGRILYSSDKLLFSTDSGDFILKQNDFQFDSNFLKNGDFGRANIKNDGGKKYLQIIDKQNNEKHVLEIIGYNDKTLNSVQGTRGSRRSIRSSHKGNSLPQTENDIYLIKSFRKLFLGKKVDIQIVGDSYKNPSDKPLDKYSVSTNQSNTTMSTKKEKESFYFVTDVKLKNQDKNPLTLNEDIINITNTKNSDDTKYCEVIGINPHKKLITKTDNSEIIIIDSRGKELPRGSIIKLESRYDMDIDNNYSQNDLLHDIPEEVLRVISDKVFNLVEDLRFVETIFYRFGSLISQNTKTTKEKYKSILDLLRRRFSKKVNSNFNPRSLDKLSKEIISGDELRNILEEASDNINSIKQELNYSNIKPTYQVDAKFVKNQNHLVEITEEEIGNDEDKNRKKLIHFSIDTENLQTPLVKKLFGVVEFCYNNNRVNRLELRIFQGNIELDNEFKKNVEEIFIKWIKSEKKDGEILFYQETEKDLLANKNYSNNIGLRISI